MVEEGFASITVRGLTDRAGVSTRSLYECFPSSEDVPSLEACLVHAQLLTMSELLAYLARARSGAADDEARVRRVVGALVSALADDPEAARLLLAELPGAGPTATRQARRAWRLIGEQLAESAGLDPRRADLPPHHIAGLGAGVLGVGRARLLAGRLNDLRSPDMAESLSRWVLSLRDVPTARLRQLDRRAACRAAEAELAAPVPSSKCPAKEEGVDARAGDRALLRAAARRLAADRGRRDLRVEKVCALAGLSRGCFNRCFEDVEDCLVEAIEEEATAALARASACVAENESTLQVVASLSIGLARPGVASLAQCGERGLRSREILIAHTAGLLDARLPRVPIGWGSTAAASAAALWGVIEAEVDEEGIRPSPSGRAYLALAPLTGPTEAIAALAAGDQDLGTTTTEETHS